MTRVPIGLTARVLGVLVVLGVAVFPLYWMLVTALTGNTDLFAPSPRLLPDLSQLGVFGDAVADGRTLGWLLNSFVIGVGTMLASIGLGIPLAYALSRFSFRGKVVVTVVLLFTQMLPEALMVVPLFSLFRRFGLLDSLAGLVIANTAFVLPIVALILKGAIDGIPRELEEAARVDGARPLVGPDPDQRASHRAVDRRRGGHRLLPRVERVRLRGHVHLRHRSCSRRRSGSRASSASSARPSRP